MLLLSLLVVSVVIQMHQHRYPSVLLALFLALSSHLNSGFRPHHTTEKAHTEVLNDIQLNSDASNA